MNNFCVPSSFLELIHFFVATFQKILMKNVDVHIVLAQSSAQAKLSKENPALTELDLAFGLSL